jgi:hypothetical protein
MLLDLEYSPRPDEPAIYDAAPRFFRAQMINGVITVPRMNNSGVHA